MVNCEELESKNNTLNMSVIKNLTGGIDITCRSLWSANLLVYMPQFKLSVCLNDIPPMSNDDGGSRRRVRVVPFDCKFVDDPDDPEYATLKKNGKVHKVNRGYAQRLKDFRLPLMWKLMKYYDIFTKDGSKLLMTKSIQKATDLYFAGQDTIGEWIEEHLEKDPSNLAEHSSWFITKKEIDNEYKGSHDLRKHIGTGNKKTFIEILERKTGDLVKEDQFEGRVVKNFYRGWRLRVDDDFGGDKINDEF